MEFSVINGYTCQILNDKIPYPFGDDGMGPDIIVRTGDDILLMRDEDSIWNIDELKREIQIRESKNWRSIERKNENMKYHELLLSMMISYRRDVTIECLFRKYNHIDTLCLAC